MARRVFHSAPNSKGGWSVKSNGRTISNHRKQSAAERAATSAGRRVRAAGGLSQAVLHRADGTIREERTYGSDPRKTPG